MLISHEWLRTFVPHSLSPEALRELLSAHVATVDNIELLRADLSAIVVARVVEARRHPNSDHLWVTRVDDGSGQLLDVVCGAPNVTEGARYPFARTGTTLPGGLKIEKRKIRGETSNGMLCSARELGLGEDQDGIMELDVDVPAGTALLAAMPVGDVRYDIDVLPNRPDLLSHLGLAREVAALTGVPLGDPEEAFGTEPDAAPAGADHAFHVIEFEGALIPVDALRSEESASARHADGSPMTRPFPLPPSPFPAGKVVLEDPEGAPRYMGVVMRGVKVGPSPDWLVQRLHGAGLRSISNVVDATNYMLHGYGQPMHAFDLARLAQSTIVVRRARPGERLLTLDGVERTLQPEMTVIADAERAVAVAGVIGGRDSEVTERTTDIFLEVACFSPRHVRATRRALGLSTDASHRFERGIDPELAPRALALATRLITRIAGGRVDGAPMDVGAPPPRSAPVTLRPERVARLLGDDVRSEEITTLLRGIGFEVMPAGENALRVAPPSWRLDVSRDVDLVEEVARLRGYDVLSDELRSFRPGSVPDHPFFVIAGRVRNALAGLGLLEVLPLPFVRGSDETHVRVKNPLADDEPHLRRSILETLARRAEYNLSRMHGDLRLFEIGSAFTPRDGALPLEEFRVGALIMGRRRPQHFTDVKKKIFDAWDAKALGERIAELVRPGEVSHLEPGNDERLLWTVVDDSSGRAVGAVERVALDRPVWAAEAFGVEIAIGEISNATVAARGEHDYAASDVSPRTRHATFRPLPTTPPAEFDLALLVGETRSAADVAAVIRRSAGELLESAELFDEFRGQGVPPGFRSLAWRLTFRDPVRTLRDKEVEGRREKILRALESELGVRPRTA